MQLLVPNLSFYGGNFNTTLLKNSLRRLLQRTPGRRKLRGNQILEVKHLFIRCFPASEQSAWFLDERNAEIPKSDVFCTPDNTQGEKPGTHGILEN